MFAQMMVPHHQQAVDMADLAQSKAQSPQLKDLAAKIKVAQGPEISTMNTWLKQWGRPRHRRGDGPRHRRHDADADMTNLRQSSGAEFDGRWLTMMIAHHQGAITMAKDALSSTTNPKVKALAQSIVDGQDREIGTTRGTLSAR